MKEQIGLARELLTSVRHMALATVNEDGSPHNTPLFLIYNDDLSKIYWGSHPDSLHSKNIERTGVGYVVVYDSNTWGKGGLYIKLKKAHCVAGDELPEALRVHNKARARFGSSPLDIEYYQGPEGQKMYVADVDKIELFVSHIDEDGHVLKEERVEIDAQGLL